MDVFKELIYVLGGSTIGMAAIAWLAKQLLTHFLSKDIESYKAKLDAQYLLELERLRSDLVRQNMEHEITFRRVEEKVVDHLAKTYEYLFRLYESVSSYVKLIEWSSEPSKEEKLATVNENNKAFWDYFLVNRVYVPPKLYARTREVANKLTSIANDFTHGQEKEKRGIFPKNVENDHWTKAFDAIKQEASPLFTAFVGDIQKRLGVVDIDDTSEAPSISMDAPKIEKRKENTNSALGSSVAE